MNLKVDFQNAVLCASCGGHCCKRYPGITHPRDWTDPVNEAIMQDRLIEAFKTGFWSVDWWDGDPRVDTSDMSLEELGTFLSTEGRLRCAYFIRPRMKGKPIRDPAWDGECSLLGPTGCTLSHDSRPVECRWLRPSKNFPDECDFPQDLGEKIVGKRTLAVAWIPYHHVIKAAYEAAAKALGLEDLEL